MKNYINKLLILLTISFLFTLTCIAQSNTIEFDVNGLKVILRQTQKETIAAAMYFRGGSSNYTAENAGIESLALSALIECGTKNFPPDNFNDKIDEYGLHLSSDVENDFGRIKLKCITSYFNEGWKLFTDAITAPLFNEQKFSFLKERSINDLNFKLSNTDDRLRRFAEEFAFEGTHYAVSPDGTVAGLQTLTRDAVKNYYYNTLLNKNRMFLVVAGKISRIELQKRVEAAFSSIPSKPYEPLKFENTLFTKDIYKVDARPIATNYIAGIMNAPDLSSPDYPAFKIATSFLNSAFFDVIRIEKHLSYAPSASLIDKKNSYVLLYASTQDPKETVRLMRNIINYLKENIMNEASLINFKNSRSLSYKRNQELMSDIVDQLGNAEILGNWKLAENLPERTSTVTGRELQSTFKKYANNIKWYYIGDGSLAEKTFK